MENKKRAAAIAFVAVLVALFVGASAFRYLTVVAPEQEAQRQAEEQALEEQEQAMENVGKDAQQPGGGEEQTGKSEAVANYSGAELDLFTVLSNFTWYAPAAGGYAEFGEDGTVSTGQQRSSFSSQEFTVLAVEGDIESSQGATAVVKVGEEYGTMRFVQNTAETASSFSESPESDFKFYCPLIGDGSYYKLPDNEVVVDGYENGAPDAVLAHREQIDAAIAKTVEEQLPAVSRATWNKEASISYAEADASIVLMYECNDPSATVVTLVYTPSTGSCQTFVGNDESAAKEEKISDNAEGLDVLPVPAESGQEQADAQRQWEEAQAQQQEQQAAAAATAGEAAAGGEEARQ